MDKRMRTAPVDGVYALRDLNDSFALGSLKIMYLGENRNGSYFTKDAVLKAAPTLRNVPIVCNYKEEDGVIGGHDMAVVKDGDTLRLKNLTQPCGVVPESAVFSIKKEADASGTEHDYLIAENVILWKRQEVYRHINGDLGGKVDHSMEIDVTGWKKREDGLVQIDDFTFTALCLLEEYEPCFEGSELNLYAADGFAEEFDEMMRELKECYTVKISEENDDKKDEVSEKGGEKVLEKTQTEESIKEVFAEGTEETPSETPAATPAEERPADAAEDVATDYSADNAECTPDVTEEAVPEEDVFALSRQLRDAIRSALDNLGFVSKPWGEEPKYWLDDYDDEKKEVYAYENSDDRTLWGMPYEKDGDAVKIDESARRKMKWAIVEFEEGGEDATAAMFADLIARTEEKAAAFSDEYRSASEKIEAQDAELGELRKFRSDVQEEKARGEREEIFSRFNDLLGVEAFEALKANADANGIDAASLEEKCFAIRGRMNTGRASEMKKAPKLPVLSNEGKEDEPYGGLFTRYSAK